MNDTAQAMQRNRDRSMMLNSLKWPRWPLLPVKNSQIVPKGSFPECGFIIDAGPLARNGRFNIYVADIFDASACAKAVTEAPKYSYVDIDAALDAGWMVD